MTPSDVFLNWFESLPDDLRDEFALKIVWCSPRGWFPDFDLWVKNFAVVFCNHIRSLAADETHLAHGIGGLMIGLAALVDFVLLPSRRRPIGFVPSGRRGERTTKVIEGQLEKAIAEGDERREALWRRVLTDMPRIQERWEDVSSAWSELRRRELSAESISRWVDDEMLNYDGWGRRRDTPGA